MSATQLSWNAATLDERLAFLRGRPGSLTPDAMPGAGDPLAPWVRACAAGDADAFRRRLAWDGIDPDVASAAMSPRVPLDFPPAPWTRDLSQVMAVLRASTAVDVDEWERQIARLDPALPFLDLWLPLVVSAGRDLVVAVPAYEPWLADDARVALERHLAAGLCRVSELAVHGLFVTHRTGADAAAGSGYLPFVRTLLASGAAPLFSAYPVLARQVAQMVAQWKAGTADLVSRLQDDCVALEDVFGAAVTRVREVRPGLSDRHHDGRQVMHVRFESGLQLAYKPRDIAVEQAYNRCLASLGSAGMPSTPPALRTLARDGYGWVEWVEPAAAWTREEARTYFRQAGALVGVTYLLGGADLHSENLVASARGPVLVDTEMLLQPSMRPAAPSDGGDEAEPASTADSCLLSGIVSAVVIDRNGVGFDVGGLRTAVARELALPARQWTGLRTDDVAYEAVTRIRPALRNDVFVDGELQRPEDFADEICAGFEAACQFLHEHRAALTADDGALSVFADCAVRVLFRPSDQYAAALSLTATPRYQASGLARSLALETLYRVFVSEVERPRIWPLVADERAALERLDVPRVTLGAASVTLVSGAGVSVAGYYVRSGLEAARSRLLSMGAPERRAQADLLRAALAGPPGAALPGPRATDPRDQLVAAAIRIGASVRHRAQVTAEGTLAWPSTRTRTDLYGGSSGLALFLAALGAVTGEPQWGSEATPILRSLADAPVSARDTAMRLGACTGQPSLAYALAAGGALLGDLELVHAAARLVCRVPESAIDADAVLDVEGGVAGMLLAVLAVHASTPDDRLLALARRCVTRLLAAQITAGAHRGAWLAGDQPVARPGFAHGAAGIAAALSRWAERTADGTAHGAIGAAWDFERRVAADNGGRYPTERSDGSRLVMAAWCHGAPGIALGRILAPPDLVDARLRQDVQDAMLQTLQAPAGQLDHLCCGNLGRADAALTVGLAAGVEAWADGGRAIATRVAGRVLEQGRLGMRGRGFQRGAAAPELFQGLAGIGYQLLRTAAPDRLPSLLVFDAPGPRPDRGTIS